MLGYSFSSLNSELTLIYKKNLQNQRSRLNLEHIRVTFVFFYEVKRKVFKI